MFLKLHPRSLTKFGSTSDNSFKEDNNDVASLLGKYEEKKQVSQIFFFISIVLNDNYLEEGLYKSNCGPP